VKDLPASVKPYKKTPNFTADSIPKGLLKAHQTKQGTWGKIVVVHGRLLYRILEPEVFEVTLTAHNFGVVEPQVLHEIAPLGEVELYVEFYK
jgi:tellurite resistance-related uncharacterized protein